MLLLRLNHQSRKLINSFSSLKFLHFPATQPRLFSVYTSLLNLCREPERLQQIHARFILYGLHQSPTICSELMDSYANLGLLHLCKQVCNSISNPTTWLYNNLLRILSKFEVYKDTLLVYQEMALNSAYPDDETCSIVLGSCCRLLDFVNGKTIHGHIVKMGFESFYLVDKALVEMYKIFGDFGDVNDLSYWNSLIFEASQNGDAKGIFCLYKRMRMEKVQADSFAAINLLRSSVDLGSLKAGRAIHSMVVVTSLSTDLSVNTALVSMYSKLGDLYDARLLFEKMPEKDCFAWNVMISAYSQSRYPEQSVELLRSMAKASVRADLFTVLPVISSIRQLKSGQWGKEMHAYVIRNGLVHQVSVSNSLIDLHSDCGRLNYARKVFDLLANRTVISWSSMIKGYVNHGQFLNALSLFSKMKKDGHVDFVAVINILPACVNNGALEQVKYLHGYSVKLGLDMLASLKTALLVSYAKCGCIEMARKLFDEEKMSKDIITWNSMINAYAKHGNWSNCFSLYKQMNISNLEPDQLTFLGLLTACVNSGLVKEGREIFKEMKETYACQPSQEHYACMVDLLGRAGHVAEAKELVSNMPFKSDARVWGPLLSACRMHSENKVAEFAAENLITLEPKNAGNYILLSNIYAAAGKWDGVAKMRSILRDGGLRKTPGCSWLDINGKVHQFRVADRSHPKSHGIYSILSNLEWEIKEASERLENYVLHADFVHFW